MFEEKIGRFVRQERYRICWACYNKWVILWHNLHACNLHYSRQPALRLLSILDKKREIGAKSARFYLFRMTAKCGYYLWRWMVKDYNIWIYASSCNNVLQCEQLSLDKATVFLKWVSSALSYQVLKHQNNFFEK